VQNLLFFVVVLKNVAQRGEAFLVDVNTHFGVVHQETVMLLLVDSSYRRGEQRKVVYRKARVSCREGRE
jgi:adenylosuccinate lyase